jgi:hypothetical protein
MIHDHCTYVYVIFCMYVEVAFHTVFITLCYCFSAATKKMLCLGIVGLQNKLIL